MKDCAGEAREEAEAVHDVLQRIDARQEAGLYAALRRVYHRCLWRAMSALGFLPTDPDE